MPQLLHAYTNRCALGFTLMQKVGFTLLALLYVASPVDAIPDPICGLGHCDDAFVFYLLYKAWAGPTLPSGSPPPSSPIAQGLAVSPLTAPATVGGDVRANCTVSSHQQT